MSGSAPQPADLANGALGLLGAASLSALTDPTPQARACARQFGLVRDMLLAVRDWRWATAFAQLGQAVDTSGAVLPAVGPWPYMYIRPAGCVRARYVSPAVTTPALPPSGCYPVAFNPFPQDSRTPFDEGMAGVPIVGAGVQQVGMIFTTAPPTPTLAYTAQVTDTTLWEPAFCDAFQLELAAQIAIAVTGNGQLAQSWRSAADQAVAALKGEGQSQGVSNQQVGQAPWMAARAGAA